MRTATLNVMTPVSRPENLAAIAQSLALVPVGVKLRWVVVADAPHPVGVQSLLTGVYWNIEIVEGAYEKHTTGHAQRNFALDHLGEEGWWCWIDDDNIMHPSFLKHFALLTEAGWGGALFGQMRHDGYFGPDLRYIDTAQIVVHSDIIGDTRWGEHYTADGDFIREVVGKSPESFKWIDQELCYHNWLTRGE